MRLPMMLSMNEVFHIAKADAAAICLGSGYISANAVLLSNTFGSDAQVSCDGYAKIDPQETHTADSCTSAIAPREASRGAGAHALRDGHDRSRAESGG